MILAAVIAAAFGVGLSFGIDLFPPAIILPVGEGRIGFADR